MRGAGSQEIVMDNKVLEAFKNALSFSVSQCPEDALLALAHAVWYQGCQITECDLQSLVAETDSETLKRTLCILELITMFPVCPQDTAKTLFRAIGKMHSVIIEQHESKALPHCKLDVRWETQENIPRLGHVLLPYQTRHYASTQGRQHGFCE
jgi:hypothetical protein